MSCFAFQLPHCLWVQVNVQHWPGMSFTNDTTCILNENGKNSIIVVTKCKIPGSSFAPLIQFPNEKYERNQIATLGINIVLIVSTILSNGISVITIRKSYQLRNRVCYFAVLLQSLDDLSVGVLTIPLFIYYLLVPFLNNVNCTLIILALRTLFLPLGLSVATLSAMTMERYIGVIHPLQYKTKVTKKRMLMYVCGHGLGLVSVIAYSFHDPTVTEIFSRGWIGVLFLLIAFAYTRIYLVIRKLIRSEKRPVCESEGNQVGKQLIRECRRARSCFLVTICFFLLLLPVVFSRLAFIIGSVDYTLCILTGH